MGQTSGGIIASLQFFRASLSVVTLATLSSFPLHAGIISNMNAQINSGNVGLDYVIQDVCVNARDLPIAGDPAVCANHRNVRIGEKIPYLRTDFNAPDGPSFQALFSYPVPGTDGTLKVMNFKSNQTTFNANYTMNFSLARDGYDLLDTSGNYFSFIRTSDGGCYDQKFSGSNDRRTGWILFTPDLAPGTLVHMTRIDRLDANRPAGCEQVSQSKGTRTVWNSPVLIGYESGKALQSILTYHYADKDLSRSNNALEKFYFTREYGFSRWEAWIPLARCQSELTPDRCDPSRADYFLRNRCSNNVSPALTSWGNQTWVRVDCRDNTRYLALQKPLIPLDTTMGRRGGLVDVDSPLVLKFLDAETQVQAAYQQLLGRAADPRGLAKSTMLMVDQNVTIEAIRTRLRNSAEGRAYALKIANKN